jgi:3-oxoacyl-ACP reductase-like protein
LFGWSHVAWRGHEQRTRVRKFIVLVDEHAPAAIATTAAAAAAAAVAALKIRSATATAATTAAEQHAHFDDLVLQCAVVSVKLRSREAHKTGRQTHAGLQSDRGQAAGVLLLLLSTTIAAASARVYLCNNSSTVAFLESRDPSYGPNLRNEHQGPRGEDGPSGGEQNHPPDGVATHHAVRRDGRR